MHEFMRINVLLIHVINGPALTQSFGILIIIPIIIMIAIMLL